MRVPWILVALVGCGGHDAGSTDAPAADAADASACQPQGAVGAFYRRPTNPRLVAGHRTYTNGLVDVLFADPDLRWDDASQLWQLYVHAPQAVNFQSANTETIRHATSPDLTTWSIDDAASLTIASDPGAWDHTHTETPSVVYNPDAPADRRYMLFYSGGSEMFPYPGYSFANYGIGMAISADGATFTRLSAAESPHGKAGLVLTQPDVYPGTTSGVVSDPEIAFVAGTYHLWFSSFACNGTMCATSTDYGIAHATSNDGIHWTIAEAPVRSLLRASADPNSGGGQPSVIYDDVHCRWEMWLKSDMMNEASNQPVDFNNMVGVWHATSYDAVQWTINYGGPRDLAWNATTPDTGEHLGLLTGADVAVKNGGRYMIYGGFDDQNVPNGYALPTSTSYVSGVTTLDVATRDVP